MNQTEEILSRLAQLFGTKSDSELGNALGVARTTVSSWRIRNSVPYAECVRVAQHDRRVSLEWLLTGEGSVYRATAGELPRIKTIEEIDDALRLLDEEQRQEIFSRTQEMLKVNTMEREMKEMRAKLEQLEQAKKE